MIQGRDIVVLSYLSTRPEESSWTIRSLAAELEMATAGVQRSVKSLIDGGLLTGRRQRGVSPWVVRRRVPGFLIHGVRPNFPPVVLGDNVRGVAAGSFAAPLRSLFATDGELAFRFVWPYALGQELGTAIMPLHESVPRIVDAHPEPGGPGELLALIDAVRYGPGRIRTMAADLINKGFQV